MSWFKTPEQLNDEKKAALVKQVEQQRKAQEALGVTVNGIRYAGDESNRNALAEAQDMAEDAGMIVFARWKDSDGAFHIDHPVQDVIDARRAIGYRRAALIDLEGQYGAQVMDGSLTTTDNLTWEV